MKTQLRRLAYIMHLFDIESFYSISLYEHGIILQGRYNQKIAKTCAAHKFKTSVSDSGYVIFKRGVIDITLT